MEPPGCRLFGGMISVVKGLCSQIPKDVIRLNHPVCEIERLENGVRVTVGRLDEKPKCRLLASGIILALPPRLAARSILFTPDLSYDLTQAMLKSSTWMAGQEAGWRQASLLLVGAGLGFALYRSGFGFAGAWRAVLVDRRGGLPRRRVGDRRRGPGGRLRRAGLDYREWATVTEHASLQAFRSAVRPARCWAFSTRGRRSHDSVAFAAGDALLFGPETRGLPEAVLQDLGQEAVLRLPMVAGSRSLNLSNTVAVVVYEAWRQQDFR